MAKLDDLVVGGWDIFEDTAYEAAVHAKVLEPTLLEKLKSPLDAIKPMKAVFDPEYIKRITGPNVKDRGSKMDKAEMLMEDIRQFQDSTGPSRRGSTCCGPTEQFHKSPALPQT